MMKLLIAILLSSVALGLFACGKSKETPAAPSPPALGFTYQTTSETVNPANNWGTLRIELSKKITQDELTTLAKKLRAEKSNYGYLSIFFIVKGMNGHALPWAAAHFEPDMKVQINGSTEEEQSKAALVAGQNIDGKVIGKWHEDDFTHSTFVIFEKGGKTYVRQIDEQGILSDSGPNPGALPDEQLKKKKVGLATRLIETEHPDEYFEFSNDSDLEFYDEDGGYYTTAAKIP